MPNHCYNTLTFCGPEQVLQQIKIDLSHTSFSEDENGNTTLHYEPLHFNNIIPMPDNISMDSASGSLPKWYTWCVDNWGTKWEPWATNCDIIDDKFLTYYFVTAWADPEPIVQALAERYMLPLHHSYTEEFGQFSGIRMYRDGEEILNIFGDFDISTADRMMDAEDAFKMMSIHFSACPECGREKELDHYSNTIDKAVCEDCCPECKQTNQGDN